MKAQASLLATAALAAALPACRTAGAPPPPPPPPAPPSPVVSPATASPAPPDERPSPTVAPALARKLVVTAWAEPARLRAGGGQTQIIVRVRRPGGAPATDVEVRLSASRGSLYSAGRPLKTSASGMTRDRLTTRETTVVVVDAEGNRVELTVPVGEGG